MDYQLPLAMMMIKKIIFEFMSSTFKSWLIANLGLTFVGVTALMIVLTFLFHGLNESRIVIIFAFVAFITAEIFEMPNTLFTILSCIVFFVHTIFLGCEIDASFVDDGILECVVFDSWHWGWNESGCIYP